MFERMSFVLSCFPDNCNFPRCGRGFGFSSQFPEAKRFVELRVLVMFEQVLMGPHVVSLLVHDDGCVDLRDLVEAADHLSSSVSGELLDFVFVVSSVDTGNPSAGGPDSSVGVVADQVLTVETGVHTNLFICL